MKPFPLFAFLGAILTAAAGAAPGDVDTGFNPNVALTYVLALAPQPDGKIVLGGNFDTVGGQDRNNIARVLSGGAVEPVAGFNIGTGTTGPITGGGHVYLTAVQPDRKILLAGYFARVNGQTRNYLARLLPDGTVESTATFNPGTGPNNIVSALVLQPDGKIVIAGDFTTINGLPRNHIARLHADGTLENTATFDPGTSADASVACLALQRDGRMVLGGIFQTFNGQSAPRLVRLRQDGTREGTADFNPGTGANDTVYTIAVQPDGRILLGGKFTTINGAARSGIARLLADGTLESTAIFNPGSGVSSGGKVFSLGLQADGKILAGGQFATMNGLPRTGLARLMANGNVEDANAFNTSLTAQPGPAFVMGVAVQSDGKVLLGGWFHAVNGTTRNLCARLLNDQAVQSLTVPDRSSVRWDRSGAAGEIEHVICELSTDNGGTWTPQGAANRVAGGWLRPGLTLPPGGMIRARGRTSGGYWTSSSGIVEAVTPFYLPTSLEAWRQTNFGRTDNTGNAADNADPDRDGLENLIEYAFGRDPNVPDVQTKLPQWQLTDDDYSLTFTRPADVSGITYVAEYSTSLAPESWSPAVNVSTPPAYTFFAPAVTQRLYLRVRVTVP